MAPSNPSHGTKVTPGQDAPVTRENPGVVTTESLASESAKEGGAFASNPHPHSENLTSSTDYTSSNSAAGQSKTSGASKSASSSAGTAPTYVSNQYHSDPSGPHGKNIKEGDWDESRAKDGLKKALESEPGSSNDPGRLAEQQMQLNQNRSGRDAGPREDKLDTETKYDALNSETSA